MNKCSTNQFVNHLLRYLFALGFMLFFGVGLKAQTDYPIGTGTATNTTTSYPCPLPDYWEGSRSQFLYLASELTASGMTPGYISAIKFNVITANSGTLPAIEQYSIKIGTSTVSTLNSATWENAPNTVFGPIDYTATAGINTFSFATPFFWNGTDNIIIEVCSGDPASSSGTYWTNNNLVTWTTGLSFNGSHTYASDNVGNACGTTSTSGSATDNPTNRPNIIFSLTPAAACAGVPNAGSAASTSTNILCVGTPFTLSLSGATVATGLTYQWQSSTNNSTWVNITGATASIFNTTQTASVMYYRCIVTCTAGGASSNSASILVNSASGPLYSTLPYTESFETAWSNACNTRDVPNSYWKNTPATGNNSWRRDDDGIAAAWTSTSGAYTPAASLGARSARFHSFNTTAGTSGTIDLYVNCNTGIVNKRLLYDFINTSGTDSLTVLLSTDGGTTFVRLDSALTSTTWRTKTIYFASTSATSVIRFKATGDLGATDIGIDNLFLSNWADCSGTPVGGTSTATPANVCAGVPVNLSATGFTAANGITYQWQASTDNGTTWSNIVGATSITATTTQVATTKYRLMVTCTLTGGGVAYSTESTVTSPLLPGGTYTINKALPTTWPGPPGSNFNSFAAAYASLSCGVSAPVVFDVVAGSGPYNEQLVINGTVAGTNAVKTITFKGNGNVIAFNSTNSNDRAVIKLKNTRYFIFDSLTVNANAGTYGYGFHLTSNADSIVIKKCTINSNTTATSTNFAGIVISGSESDAIGTGTTLCDFNIIDSNTINGGYYGITQTATFSGGANGNNRITNNKINDFYSYGVYTSASYSTLIERNTISRPTRSGVTDFYGIYFTAQNNNAFVSKNKIVNPFGGALSSTSVFYGIYFNSSSPSAGNDYIVSNNVIAGTNGNGIQYGIYNTGTSSMQLFHNTISLDSLTSTSTATARGFYVTGAISGLIYYNNIISITRGGTGSKHCIYFANNFNFVSDNNVFYTTTAATNFVGYYNAANRATLQAWQTATTQDLLSLSNEPVYNAPNIPTYDFTPSNAAIDNKGFPLGVIFDDINGTVRSLTTPDIGAYEYTAPACVAPPVVGATQISPLSTCQNTSILLKLQMGSYGSAQTFQWQVSSTLTGTYTNLGNPKLTPDTTINADTTYYFRCAVTCGGSTVYSTPVQVIVTPALKAGSYTINNNAANTFIPGQVGGNFQSYNQALAAMSCGITGAVVFNVDAASGPYNEQLIFADSIWGTSPLKTITFNGNGTTIKFSSTNTNERAVIKLKKADYIIFDSLTIDSRGTNLYGYGLQLINNADSNIVRNCTIYASDNSTSTNYVGVVINSVDAGATTLGNTFCDANTFINNNIIGGYYGVTLVGSATATQYLNGNKFINNRISEFYTQGFYIGGTINTLLEKNSISRPTRSTSIGTPYGIYLTGAPNNSLVISKNKIFNLFGGLAASTQSAYGIYHNSVSASSGLETIVSNNLIYQLGGNGSNYGIYNLGSNGVNYYHNTIALDNTTSTTTSIVAGFYQTTTATGLQFKNNNVSLNYSGTGAKYCMYLATTTSDITSDYNNFYLGTLGTNNFIGRYGTANAATLAIWKTTATKDANSQNQDPLYVASTTGNYKPQSLALDNKGVTGLNISDDILNIARSVSTPDIGAYEFAPAPCPSPLLGGTATVTPSSGLCLEMPIRLNLTGNSPLGSLTFQWQNSANGTSGWTNIGPLQYNPIFDTVTTVNTYYRCIVSCGPNPSTFVYSSVVQVNLNAILAGGTYTIDGTTPTSWPTGINFNTFQEAVNALMCGIQSSVIFNVKTGTYNEQIRIPYIPGTSSTKTVTFKAANDIASSATLTYASSLFASNYTLKLDSTKYIYFRNLTIAATGTTGYGRAVEIAGTSANDSITNCIINAPSVINTSNTFAGIYSNPMRGTNIVLKGNKINNGAVGIYISGVSGTSRALNEVIDSNIVSGAYQYGISTNFTEQLKLTRNIVNVASPSAATSYGIYANETDSAYNVSNNKININNTLGLIYGIQLVASSGAASTYGNLINNDITATSGNNSTLYGIYVTSSPRVNVLNNVVAISTTGNSSYGLFQDNSDSANYYNNTVNSIATSSVNNHAAYFANSTTTSVNVNNNIFSHRGGGRSMYVVNPSAIISNYNMLYTSGSVLVQTPTAGYSSLLQWNAATSQDASSTVNKPAFVNDFDLHPNLSNDTVWAMHGRGVQILGNNKDHDNNGRPTTLIAGVPDLGAYEFFPTVLPTILNAVPANPAPNTEQTFYYGSDTVMRIKWTATAPPSVQVRRYSGVVPTGLAAANLDSMYFYTKVDIPGAANYDYDAKLYYYDSWLGSIPQPSQLGLGKTTPGNAWVVGFTSRNELSKRMIYQTNVNYLDKFTGLTNPYAPPVLPDRDSSNTGKRFWVAYGHHQSMTTTASTTAGNSGGSQSMVLYLSALTQTANIQVKVNGTSWVRNYLVPANTAIVSDTIPKWAADDAKMMNEGKYSRGISITSDVPINAYAHIYDGSNSGAGMLMPVGVWGYEYVTLNSAQYYDSDCYSWFYVVADNDNTLIEITPSVTTRGGKTANVPFQITLNKGEVYQVMGTTSGSTGTDISGSKVKALANAAGKCYPIAVFSGSSRTAICYFSNGDNVMQQNFPYTAWGKRYLTFGTANSASNTQYNSNKWRVLVKDPTTVVKRNGVILPAASLITLGNYYEFGITTGTGASTASYIEANQPIMVAQYMISTSADECTGLAGPTGSGDPEMIYLSPIEQGIKKAIFYNTNKSGIVANYVNVIVPTAALSSFKIDGASAPFTDMFTHPTLAGYTCIRQNFPAAAAQHSLECDSSFTAITYGLGSAESYGYNAGTLVKNLRATGGSIITTPDPLHPQNTEYACSGTSFHLSMRLAIVPTKIIWKLSSVPNIIPGTDITVNNPAPTDSVMVNGDKLYIFTLAQTHSFSSPGLYSIPVTFTAPTIGSCDSSQTDIIYVQVIPTPAIGFNIAFTPPCAGSTAGFAAQTATVSGVNASTWTWTFHNGTTATGQTSTFTYPTAGIYPVKLSVVTADGCKGDSLKQVTVNPLPTVSVVSDSISVCKDSTVTFTIQSPTAGVTYNWYSSTTSTTPLATGTSFTVTGVTATTTYYVEAVSAAGCTSATRKPVKAQVYNALANPVVTVASSTATSVTFTWGAVTGAQSYQVSVNGGAFGNPSSGATGTTHTVTGLGILTTANIIVKAIGTITCQTGTSIAVSGCTNSAPVVTQDSVAICVGNSATFNVDAPLPANVNYTWYNSSTSTTALANGTAYAINTNGSSFTANNLTPAGIYTYYSLGSNSVSGCVGTIRTKVTVNVLAPLAKPVVTVNNTLATPTSITFQWTAVTGAVGGYQVSIDNGTTWTTPSSGSTGLSHTVSGLTPNTSITILVKALGIITCQQSISDAVTGRTLIDQIFVPTAFNPNSPIPVNRTLRVYGYVIKGIQFMVFNQWGEKVFETQDQTIGWDGVYKGKPQPAGVYIYVLKMTLLNGTTSEMKGSVNLIR